MRFHSLSEWLAFQEQLHPSSIDMGLARVHDTASRMGLAKAPCPVFTVAGTNGKGSTASFIAAMLQAGGHRVGLYTSPHLVHYNERVMVDGVAASDEALCDAFEAVDQARADTRLTYFEFGTLAAMQHFRAQQCEVVVLEVGMGGRLDATNAWDAEVAVVVSVGLDHMDWLGPDREAIGFEKAGVYRAGRPAICADPHPPATLVSHAHTINAHLVRVGEHYGYEVHADGTWHFRGLTRDYGPLPAPALPGLVQYGNAAAAVAALDASQGLRWDPRGLCEVRLPGRLQTLQVRPQVILDVTHNAEGARTLARQLAQDPVDGRTIALCGMMADKPVAATLMALDAEVDHWVFASLPGPRGATAEVLLAHANEASVHGTVETCDSVDAAYERALALAGVDDRVVVFGSFVTVGAVLSR